MDKSHILGIDIGTSAVKVFSGTMTSEKTFMINSIGLMPASGLDKGVISDYAMLADSVRQAVDCASSTGQMPAENVYVGIGGIGIRSFNSAGSIAPFSPKAITKQDIDRVCRSAGLSGIPEGLAVLHVLPLAFWVDKQKQDAVPIGVKGDCLEVEALVVAAPEVAINELTAAIKSKGIQINGIVANAIVCAQALLADADKLNGMVIDIGAGTTDMAIFRNGHICYTTSIPLGGNYITRDIMQALGISERHAEGIKRYYSRLDRSLRGQAVTLDCNDYGTTDKHISYDFLANVIESRVEEIVFLIQEYVKDLIADNPLDVMLFSGGCAAMPSFVTSLEKCFGLEVRTQMPKELSSEYAYSSNIACYGIMSYASQNAISTENNASVDSWKSLLVKIKRLF